MILKCEFSKRACSFFAELTCSQSGRVDNGTTTAAEIIKSLNESTTKYPVSISPYLVWKRRVPLAVLALGASLAAQGGALWVRHDATSIIGSLTNERTAGS